MEGHLDDVGRPGEREEEGAGSAALGLEGVLEAVVDQLHDHLRHQLVGRGHLASPQRLDALLPHGLHIRGGGGGGGPPR